MFKRLTLRRHERLIAGVIASHENERDRFTLASLFSSVLSRDNDRFDSDLFFERAGVNNWWASW
jgi:hypothetical protein